MFFKTKRSPRKTTRQTLSTELLEPKAMFNGTPLPAVESPTTDTASVEIAEEAVVGLKEDAILKIPKSGSVQGEGVNGKDLCIDVEWMSPGPDHTGLFSNGTYSYQNEDGSFTNNNKGDEWDSDKPEPFPGFWDFWEEDPGWPWCPEDGGIPPIDDEGECPTDDDTGGTDGGTSGGGESGPSDDDDEECPYEMNGDVENDLNLGATPNNRSSGTTTPRSQVFARMGR